MNNKPRNPKAVPDGIDLRDWFAGLAMQAIIRQFHEPVGTYNKDVADSAYWYADAMLAARERSHD